MEKGKEKRYSKVNKMKCPVCSQKIGLRGFVQHLTMKHDYRTSEAKTKRDELREGGMARKTVSHNEKSREPQSEPRENSSKEASNSSKPRKSLKRREEFRRIGRDIVELSAESEKESVKDNIELLRKSVFHPDRASVVKVRDIIFLIESFSYPLKLKLRTKELFDGYDLHARTYPNVEEIAVTVMKRIREKMMELKEK